MYSKHSYSVVFATNRPLIFSAFRAVARAHGIEAVMCDFADVTDVADDDGGSPTCVVVDVCADPYAAVEVGASCRRIRDSALVLLLTADRSLTLPMLAALLRCRPAGVLGCRTTWDELTTLLRLIMDGQVVLHLDRAGTSGLLLEQSLW